jgi:hypothetical protein
MIVRPVLQSTAVSWSYFTTLHIRHLNPLTFLYTHIVFFLEEFKKLCPDGPGRGEKGEDLNECALIPEPCAGGGICVNTDGSFRCECQQGYVLDSSQRRCIGERITHRQKSAVYIVDYGHEDDRCSFSSKFVTKSNIRFFFFTAVQSIIGWNRKHGSSGEVLNKFCKPSIFFLAIFS